MTDPPWLQLPDLYLVYMNRFQLTSDRVFSFLTLAGRKRSWTRQWLKAFAVLLNRKWRLCVSTVVRRDSLDRLKEKPTLALQKSDGLPTDSMDSLCLNTYGRTWVSYVALEGYTTVLSAPKLKSSVSRKAFAFCWIVLLERYQTVLKCFS